MEQTQRKKLLPHEQRGNARSRRKLTTSRPNMDQSAKKWLHKTASKNFWRVAKWYKYDDLVQDGYVQWCRMLRLYPNAVDAPHRMRLFQLCYMSHVTNLANKRTRDIDESCVTDLLCNDITETQLFDNLTPVPHDHNDNMLIKLRAMSAPAPVQAILRAFTDPNMCKRLRSKYRKRPDGSWQTLNDKLCTLTGYNPKLIDLVSIMHAWFGEEPFSEVITIDGFGLDIGLARERYEGAHPRP